MKSLILKGATEIIGQNIQLGFVQFFKSHLNENTSIIFGLLSFTLIITVTTFLERRTEKRKRKARISLQT